MQTIKFSILFSPVKRFVCLCSRKLFLVQLRACKPLRILFVLKKLTRKFSQIIVLSCNDMLMIWKNKCYIKITNKFIDGVLIFYVFRPRNIQSIFIQIQSRYFQQEFCCSNKYFSFYGDLYHVLYPQHLGFLILSLGSNNINKCGFK